MNRRGQAVRSAPRVWTHVLRMFPQNRAPLMTVLIGSWGARVERRAKRIVQAKLCAFCFSPAVCRPDSIPFVCAVYGAPDTSLG